MVSKDAVRIQTSIMSKMEKKLLEWLAIRMPRWMNPDILTGIGLAGSFIAGGGYALSSLDKGFLWLSSFGFVVNWFGDSLDGTLARVRKIERPKYGFYLDHNVDAITALVICIGAGMSPFVSFSVVMLLLAGYFLLCIFTYINTYLNDIFKISYSGLGPTELRIVIIIINTLFFFLSSDHPDILIFGIKLKFFDLFALGVALILMALYTFSFLKGRMEYKKADPPRE
jgi:archaetidylinositol phosphate synthase